MADISADLKALLEKGRLILGSQRTLKALCAKQLETVYLARTANPEVKDAVRHAAKLTGTAIIQTPFSSEELGTICRKQFGAQVIGVTREAE